LLELLEAFADDAGPALRLIRATRHTHEATPVHTMAHLPKWHTATGLVRAMRDLMLPVILKFAANAAKAKQLYGYQIDWSPA